MYATSVAQRSVLKATVSVKRPYGLTPYTCRCYRCCALERTQKIQAICTSVLSASKTQSKKSIILTSCTSSQRKRTKKELPNSYIKLLNYQHPIVRFYGKRGLGPDQNHYNQSRRWSWLQTTLAQITRIVPKWIYAVLKIISQFTIFEQLPLALKIFTVWNILFRFRIFEQLALALKNRFALEFFTVLIFNMLFYIQDFWATCTCPEKQRVLWIHCTEYVFFIIQIFEQLALALKNRVTLEFLTVLKYFFIIQDFWATRVCPENRFCPKSFQARGGGRPPRPPASYAYAPSSYCCLTRQSPCFACAL